MSFTMYSTYVTTLSRSRVASAGCVGTRQWSFLPARDAAPSHSRRPCMFVTRACTPVAGDGRSAPAVPLRPPGCTGSRSFFSWTTFTHVHSTVLHEQTGEGRGGEARGARTSISGASSQTRRAEQSCIFAVCAIVCARLLVGVRCTTPAGGLEPRFRAF